MRYIDPTGLSTGVDEETGIIISASDDGDCDVYMYPTVDGTRFVNDTTKRFIPTTIGKAKYYSFPAIGIGLGVGSNLGGE